jgi:hypothetical protein
VQLVTLFCTGRVLVHMTGSTAWQAVVYPLRCRSVSSVEQRQQCTCARAAQVNCNVSALPAEVCELSNLQLLNLSQNAPLHQHDVGKLAEAPLRKVRRMLLPQAALSACGHMLRLECTASAVQTCSESAVLSAACLLQTAGLAMRSHWQPEVKAAAVSAVDALGCMPSIADCWQAFCSVHLRSQHLRCCAACGLTWTLMD